MTGQGYPQQADPGLKSRRRTIALPISLLLPQEADEQLIVESFGLGVIERILKDFGRTGSLLSVSNEAGKCLLVALCDDRRATVEQWLSRVEASGGDVAGLAGQPVAVVDYVSVSREGGARTGDLLRAAMGLLREDGLSCVLSECESLRHLIYWLRFGCACVSGIPAGLAGPTEGTSATTRRQQAQELRKALRHLRNLHPIPGSRKTTDYRLVPAVYLAIPL